MNNEITIAVCSLAVLAVGSWLIYEIAVAVKSVSNSMKFDDESDNIRSCEPNPPRYDHTKSYSRFTSDPRLYRVSIPGPGIPGPGIPRYVYSYVVNNDYDYDMEM